MHVACPININNWMFLLFLSGNILGYEFHNFRTRNIMLIEPIDENITLDIHEDNATYHDFPLKMCMLNYKIMI